MTAYFQAATVEEALQVLTFLTGRQIRKDGAFYFVGGEGEESVVALPAGALDASAVKVLGEENAVVADRSLLFRGDNSAVQDAEALIGNLEEIQDTVDVSAFRLVVLDVADRDRKPVNDWLEAFQLSATLTEDGFSYAADLSALVEFIETSGSSEVLTETVVTLVDGEKTTLNAGQILEREISQAVPTDSGRTNFRTGFDRLNIGFDLDITAKRLLTGWRIESTVSDSSFVNSQETRTEYSGVQLVRDGDSSPFLVADLHRQSATNIQERPNAGLLSWFKREDRNVGSRRLLVVLEPVLEPMVLPELPFRDPSRELEQSPEPPRARPVYSSKASIEAVRQPVDRRRFGHPARRLGR